MSACACSASVFKSARAQSMRCCQPEAAEVMAGSAKEWSHRESGLSTTVGESATLECEQKGGGGGGEVHR